jgi:TetR/AcrR family transcriptional regulator, cholesterol catabolism regulator
MAPTRARRTVSPARERGPRRREEEVLDAAARVFSERGYAHATVQHVANELGILKGSLYYYIRTKEDLLCRLLEHVHDEVDAILAAVEAETAGMPPLQRLEEYVRRQTLHSVSNLARLSVYYHDIDHLSPVRRRAILDRRAPHEAYVTELIGQAQRSGDARRDVEPRILSNCVFATIIWTYRWFRVGGATSAKAAADACAGYAVAGVRA